MLDSLANVKSRLGITTSDYDTFLTAQITLVSDVIEAYCRRRFALADYSQTFYRTDNPVSRTMELYHFPADEIVSITVDGVVIPADEYRLHNPTARVLAIDCGPFFQGEETVVLYSAGYATIPTPILSVLDTIVGERYNKKVAGIDLNFGSDVQRISIPGAISIDFDYTLKNNERSSAFGSILGSQVNILDSYRSERAVIGSGKLEYVEELP